MHTTQTIDVPAAPAAVFALVERLDRYPRWLTLVHSAEPDPPAEGDAGPAWSVELRAQVGLFARSKRLRMVRREHAPDRLVVFERAETDGRDHARWALRAELIELAGGTRLSMHLAYDGGLWTAGLLERVLDEQIRRGREGLRRLLSEQPTR